MLADLGFAKGTKDKRDSKDRTDEDTVCIPKEPSQAGCGSVQKRGAISRSSGVLSKPDKEPARSAADRAVENRIMIRIVNENHKLDTLSGSYIIGLPGWEDCSMMKHVQRTKGRPLENLLGRMNLLDVSLVRLIFGHCLRAHDKHVYDVLTILIKLNLRLHKWVISTAMCTLLLLFFLNLRDIL